LFAGLSLFTLSLTLSNANEKPVAILDFKFEKNPIMDRFIGRIVSGGKVNLKDANVEK
jgi:hypothetical protein